MRASRRKTAPMRSPSSTAGLHAKMPGDTITHHAIPPNTFSTPSLQSLIYATSNDRYPGAPGTSLHRAKVETARAMAASKREMQKDLERREEMKRLGILGVGKKRVVGGSSAASNGGNSRYGTPPTATERTRRGATTSTSAAAAAGGPLQHSLSSSSSSSSASARPSRSNGKSLANAIDHSTLPVPLNAAAAIPGSPLLSSSGRIRRPASASRGASPMPLTSQASAHANGTVSSRVRSPIVAPIELDGLETSSRAEDARTTLAGS